MKLPKEPRPHAGRQEASHAAAEVARAGASRRRRSAGPLDDSPRQVAQRARLQAGFGPRVVQRDDGEGRSGLPPLEIDDLLVLIRAAAVAAWKTYAYHATKLRNVDSILRSGLDPGRGGTGAAVGNAHFEQESRGRVHYTRSEPLAAEYKRHFEGGTPFKRQDPDPAPAGILRVALGREQLATEEDDPDTPKADRAFRNTAAIPAARIRLMGPKPLPAKRKGKAPLVPGANAAAWKDHVVRSFEDTGALMSNLPPEGTDVLFRVMRQGHDIMTIMQLVKQGLQSYTAEEVLGWSEQSRKDNPRVAQSLMDVMGAPFFRKTPRT